MTRDGPKLDDRDAELIRQLAESERGVPPRRRRWTHRALAEEFGISKRYVTMILSYRRK